MPNTRITTCSLMGGDGPARVARWAGAKVAAGRLRVNSTDKLRNWLNLDRSV